MVRNYTDKELLDAVKKLKSFIGIPEKRWILGVRSNEDIPNYFDDKFYEFEGEKFIRVVRGTTNPGLSILQGGYRNFNKLGAAVLKSNEWYYNVWKYGLHRGKMPALLQVGSQVKVYRDGDNDSKSEELGKIQEGWFGINYHTNTYDFRKGNLKLTTNNIGEWSAGCQVINEREKYMEQMAHYKKALEDKTQIYVSYCLINEF